MLTSFQERRIELEAAAIYLRTGGSGPPLLLLHGYPQTHLMWHKVAPKLAEHFTLVMPDLRGYGLSRGPQADANHSAYSKRAMALDMLEVMERLGFPRFYLAGHDRGARVGYRLCLDHPGRVERLALLDILPTLEVWEAMDAQGALTTYHWSFLAVPAPVPEHLIGQDSDFYIRHLLDRWAGRPGALAPEAVAAYVAQFHNPAILAATCEDYRAGATLDREHDQADREAGRKINCPLLLLWAKDYKGLGDQDPLTIWRRWAGEVEGRMLDCGHFLAEEAPEDTLEALLEFFKRD